MQRVCSVLTKDIVIGNCDFGACGDGENLGPNSLHHEDNENEKSCFQYWASTHQADISLVTSPPGRGSVHILGGLDNYEMDCLEDKFRLYCPDHFYWYNQRVQALENFWTEKENWATKLLCFWNQLCLLKKHLTGPGSCPVPGVGLVLHLQLLLLLLAALNCLLLLELLWSLSWLIWLGATHFLSWAAPPCGWQCRCPPPHTSWKASCKLSGSWTQSSLRNSYPLLCLHVCFLNA